MALHKIGPVRPSFYQAQPQITYLNLGFVLKGWMDVQCCGVRMCVCGSETAANEVQLQVPGEEPRRALQRQQECVSSLAQ